MSARQHQNSRNKSINNKARYNQDSSSFKNAWKADDSNNFQSRSRYSSVSDPIWSDSEEHFPKLGAAASASRSNVWEERKSKQEAIKAMEPQNQYDENAMLQRALRLSLMEAQEEEKLRQIEEEQLKIQLQALQLSSDEGFPDVLEDLNAADEFIVTRSGHNGSGDCQTKEHFQSEKINHSTRIEYLNEKPQNSSGARPKINKAIERFGGWGLKDNKSHNNFEKLSNFVDDVVSERTVKRPNKYKTSDSLNSQSKSTKENDNLNKKDLHDVSFKKDKKSEIVQDSLNDNTLFDEKGTFIDDEDNCCDSDISKEVAKMSSISPNKVLDTWLDSDDQGIWNKNVSNEKKEYVAGIETSTNAIDFQTFNDKPNSGDLDYYDSDHSEKHSSLDFSSKIIESENNTWSGTTHCAHNELPVNKSSLYNYDLSDGNSSVFSLHEPTEVSPLATDSIWSNESPKNSSYFSCIDKENVSFKADFDIKVESNDSDLNNKSFHEVPSCENIEIPPILPPQPCATVSSVNKDNTSMTDISDTDSSVNPPILPPQPVPEIPAFQIPMMTNPLLNPMFPGLNPMLGFGFGMDPFLMRQMLILNNPLLANQILALDQYCRSLGMPDFFSTPSLMPNAAVPGMINPCLVQNTLQNTINVNLPSEAPQLQTECNTNMSDSNINNPNITENCFKNSNVLSVVDSPIDHDMRNSIGNSGDDPWFKSYNDNVPVIPPPKPLCNDVNSNDMAEIPKLPKSSQSASCFSDSMLADSYIPDKSISQPAVVNKVNPIEACITKTEINGWSDNEDDFVDTKKYKTNWDDGWGDAWGSDPVPPKPLKNPSLYEDKKKTAFRQPAKQPQISRFNRNRT